MKQVLILNGPNLNKLGERDQGIYGGQTLNQINSDLETLADTLGLKLSFFHSNWEGELIDCIQSFTGDAVVLNAGAYSHYSIALADCLRDCKKVKIEVHISNIFAREEFRKTSVISPVCDGVISGFGGESYALALKYLAGR